MWSCARYTLLVLYPTASWGSFNKQEDVFMGMAVTIKHIQLLPVFEALKTRRVSGFLFLSVSAFLFSFKVPNRTLF